MGLKERWRFDVFSAIIKRCADPGERNPVVVWCDGKVFGFAEEAKAAARRQCRYTCRI
jgi:hypothetical protein